jgi:hypothetical protein
VREYYQTHLRGLFFWSYPEDPDSALWSCYMEEDTEMIEEWMKEGYSAEVY